MTFTTQLWLAILVLIAFGYAVRLYSRSDYTTWESILYLPAYLLTRLLWRVYFTNQPPVEMRGGAVLAANHRSSIDPMFIQLAARRRVHWMVAKEYCQNIVFGPVLRALQVIPTNRTGTDINSTKIAMEYARQNSLVGMFPEGRINLTTNPLLPVRAGAAMVAVKAGVPIIPIYIHRSPYFEPISVVSPFLMPARVGVTFGSPVYPGSHSSLAEPSQLPSQDPDSTVGSRKNSNDQASRMIHQWARTMLALAGSPNFEVQVGSEAKRRHRESLRMRQIDPE